MDTHITTTPDLDERVGTPLGKPMSLPGARQAAHHDTEDHLVEHVDAPEPGSPVFEKREPLAPSAPRKRGRRKALLGSVAVLLVVAGAGAAAWTQGEQLAAFPYQQTAMKLRNQVTSLIAPAPSATPPLSSSATQAPMEIGTRADTSPRTVVATAAHAASSAPASSISPQEVKAALEKSEFASFKLAEAAGSGRPSPAVKPTEAATEANPAALPATAPAATPPASTAPAAPINGPVPTPVPVASTTATAPVANLTINSGTAEKPVAEVGASKPSAPPAAAPATAAAPAKPRDAVQTAAALQPAPMAPKEIVNTAGLVRELGAQLEVTRLQVSQLNATVAELKELVDSRITDFDTRLSLAEAGAALVRSAKAGMPQPSTTLTGTAHIATPPGRAATSPGPAPASAPPAAPATRSVKDYRIQGASPGMVVLNVINPTPGEAPALYLNLGDQVPGLGRLKSVQQRGTAWVAQTDAGLIQ